MTFFTPDDEEVPEDVRSVLATSGLLQITEYRLFQAAHLRWYGRQTRKTVMENHYARYMFQWIVPHWVRQFCREVEERERQGRLDPGEFGVSRQRIQFSRREQWLRFCLVSALVLATFTVIIVLTNLYQPIYGLPAP